MVEMTKQKVFTREDFVKWGRIGGKLRKKKLSPELRSYIASKAGKNRWKPKKVDPS